MDWTEKYRPNTLSEVRGNNKARDQLQKWARTWDDHEEAAVLHGSPGVGKTSAAHALASDMGWELVEMNASDQRTGDDIERYAGRAAGNVTIGGAMAKAERKLSGEEAPAGNETDTTGRQLIVLDEADNVHGTADRGGGAAITALVKEANQPVVLIANEYYEMSNALRRATREIEFRDVSKRSIIPVLRDVCRREGIDFDEDALERIADSTSGDLRSAINDLQALAEGNESLVVEDVVTSERDRTKGIFDFLDEVIKELDAEDALRASYDVDENPEDIIAWLDENVPKDFEGGELADAYGFLSDADRWLGRVRATQNYTFWRYASDNMVAGVAASRGGEMGGWTRYSPPSYWSRLGRTRGKRDTRDYVAQQIADEHSVSVGTARREVLPYLATITHHCNNREAAVAMAARYNLDAKHVSFVTGSGEDTNKVQSVVDDASKLRGDHVEEGTGYFDSTPDTEVDASSDDGEVSSNTDGPSDASESSADHIETDRSETSDGENEDQSGLDDFF